MRYAVCAYENDSKLEAMQFMHRVDCGNNKI